MRYFPGAYKAGSLLFTDVAQLVARLLWEQEVGSSSLSIRISPYLTRTPEGRLWAMCWNIGGRGVIEARDPLL